MRLKNPSIAPLIPTNAFRVAGRGWLGSKSSRPSTPREELQGMSIRWNISSDFRVIECVDVETVRIVALSGSLRRRSSNSALVDAVSRLAPEGVDISVFDKLGEIPPFNPDLDSEDPPEAVGGFRATLQGADAVLISSPEYAHGVPGVLKNALDWIVGSGELVGRPIALVNATARATHAWASLAETLTVMSARVIPDASLTIPLDGRKLDADGIVADPELGRLVSAAIDALVRAARYGHPA
jgi:NAD(P)H-dependent FMN reductase